MNTFLWNEKSHHKHIVKFNFVPMQVVNMSAYIQSLISIVSAQSGFYEGHQSVEVVSDVMCDLV